MMSVEQSRAAGTADDQGGQHRIAVLLARILLVVLGGYAATSSVVAGLAVVLSRLGLARSEAVVSAAMAGFLVYLALLIWGFAERRLLRVLIVLVGLIAIGLACASLPVSGG